ncbi:MAG: hypothetical protein IPL47_03905 [Phyllobacteriaceae bacterium]|nr:hypothetical protein [Phyllobacteriaceae bacterium]
MKSLGFPAAALAVSMSAPTFAGEMASEFVLYDAADKCAVIATGGGDGDSGDWESSVCEGWRGFPVLSRFAFGRLFLFFGFPPDGDGPHGRDSFGQPHVFGPGIEWRIETEGEIHRPVATIHDWKVLGEDGNETEVFVVSRVASLADRSGCVVGYVVSTGDEQAHDKALAIADHRAKNFKCGVDKPEIAAGGADLPPLYAEPR